MICCGICSQSFKTCLHCFSAFKKKLLALGRGIKIPTYYSYHSQKGLILALNEVIIVQEAFNTARKLPQVYSIIQDHHNHGSHLFQLYHILNKLLFQPQVLPDTLIILRSAFNTAVNMKYLNHM